MNRLYCLAIAARTYIAAGYQNAFGNVSDAGKYGGEASGRLGSALADGSTSIYAVVSRVAIYALGIAALSSFVALVFFAGNKTASPEAKRRIMRVLIVAIFVFGVPSFLGLFITLKLQ